MNKILMAVAVLAACSSIAQAQTISQLDKDRAAELVKQMTLQEKISLISGAVDGFHTTRKNKKYTSYFNLLFVCV